MNLNSMHAQTISGESLGLTQCPDCHHLGFLDAASCPSCGRTFLPGVLRSKAAAEDRAFMGRYIALFLIATLTTLMVLLLVVLGDYMNSTGSFRA